MIPDMSKTAAKTTSKPRASGDDPYATVLANLTTL